MEESTKRRERLRAMSLQASRAMVTTLEPSYSLLTVPPPLLLLPQISNSPIQPPPALECQPSISNSDFFITDPLSAFTSSKRMRGVGAIGFNSSSHGVGTIGFTPSTPYHPAPSSFPTVIAGRGNNQFHMSQPPDSISYKMPSCGLHSSPWRSPVRLLTPFSGHQGTPASGRGSWNRSGGIRGFPTNSPISVLSGPHFGPWGSPNSIAQSSGTPQSISVRGSSLQISSGSSLKPATCGRGQSSNDKASVQRKPKRYYCKSMLEDPWRNLEPIVGNILEPMAGPGYWLPESISGKKRKVSETQSINKLNSKWSLAEVLADSFEEAINHD
ncbi:unnamed protein product [Musa hybrid cultivar]